MRPLRAFVLVVTGWMLSLAPAVGAEKVVKSEATAESIVRDLKYRDVKAAYLLAHSVLVDDHEQPRPVLKEHALLAIESKTNNFALNWRLVHVSLRQFGSDIPRWRAYQVYDTDYIAYRDFAQRPTQSEVEKFVVDTWWKFEGANAFGYRPLRGEVYVNTWQKALGYKPEHQYPKAKP